MKCKSGFRISFGHSFYSKADINDFKKYSELIESLYSDLTRFINICKPKDTFFEESSNSEINLIIFP